MSSESIRVLLIEDNRGEARLIEHRLSAVWASLFSLEWVDRLSTGPKRLTSEEFDVVLLDLSLPDSRGFETFAETQAQAPWMPITVLTGLDNEELTVQAVRQGAQDYLVEAEVIEGGGSLLVRSMRYAIERERTESVLRQSQIEIRRHAAYLEALNAIIAVASAAEDLTELLETALDHVLQALQLELGVIWAANHEALCCPAAEIDVDLFESGRVADSNATTVAAVEDWRQASAADGLLAVAPRAERAGVRASLCAPILAEGQPIGGLALVAAEARPWSTEEVALVEGIGRQIGIVAERLRLLEEVRAQAKELEIFVKQLQELDRLKSEFIQNVSHELRSPLALILGYTELLVDGDLGELSAQRRSSISIISRRAHMLSALVEDITLILQAEGRSSMQERVAMNELIRAAVEDFGVVAGQAGLMLEVDLPRSRLWVNGDSNLLGNAIKFTPAGGTITVRMEVKSGQMVLQVTDTGIGIPSEAQSRIFERFYPVDGSAQRRYGGVGLGLALVKELVEGHGSQIAVQNQVGRGSTFTIVLPVAEG